MKEGDVYFWKWRDGVREGSASPYHCWSRKAVVGADGRLRDTYWTDNTDKLVPLAEADLTFLGNIHEMKKIPRYEAQFYRADDVVDMRHANNSQGPVYVVPGADKNPDVMRGKLLGLIENAQQEMKYQELLIANLQNELAALEAGRLHEVTPRD